MTPAPVGLVKGEAYMFQKRTLRHLPPDTRKLAVACNDMETALGRWKRAIPQLASDEQRWRGEQRRLLAQGRPDVSIPDQAVPCQQHGITQMVTDGHCKGWHVVRYRLDAAEPGRASAGRRTQAVQLEGRADAECL